MAEYTYLSAKGLEELKEKLRHAKEVERPDVINRVAEARSLGDLKENSEYHAAKEEQGAIETKIAQLETTVARARILDTKDIDPNIVSVLSTVKVKNLKVNKEKIYTLVSPAEVDIDNNKISIKSPIGKALLNKKLGETVEAQVPAGILKFEILEINR
ncbi:MAG: transcription elongation factor GreA [Calditrichaeota bacterium]|nr:MAG: transcription elongation factor GreA [Calditrichota bacterium]